MSVLSSLFPFVVLGAIAGLDVVSFPQAMLSRPIVAATIAGALGGHAAPGLLVGAALELFALETLPFGASRYPEWGSASVVGGALFASHADAGGGAIAVAVLAALATAGVGGWTMVQHRHLVGRWTGALRDSLAAGSSGAVSSLQFRGLTADLIRGGAVTALALAAFGPLSSWLLGTLHAGESSRTVVAVLAGGTAGAAVWNVVHTTKGAAWLLAGGLVAGTVLVLAW
ncbi:MAG: PTS sugar transporter subunit IIC [Gemmatimonadales bacterium]